MSTISDRPQIVLGYGEETDESNARALNAFRNWTADVHLHAGCEVEGRRVLRIEITEIDGAAMLGNGIDPVTGEYEQAPDQDDPNAIRGYGLDFCEIQRVVIL